jgi:multisubunit Na+/H+ antiporter MnhF subunit
MIATAAVLGLAVVLAFWLIRVMTGPTLHDRALGAHAAMLTGALMAAALAALAERAEWLDLAIALVFADVLMVVAMLKVVRLRSLQTALARPDA